jgi:hypothetical protein
MDTSGGNVVLGSSSKTVVKVSVEVATFVSHEVMIQSLPGVDELVEAEVVVEEFTKRPENDEYRRIWATGSSTYFRGTDKMQESRAIS